MATSRRYFRASILGVSMSMIERFFCGLQIIFEYFSRLLDDFEVGSLFPDSFEHLS